MDLDGNTAPGTAISSAYATTSNASAIFSYFVSDPDGAYLARKLHIGLDLISLKMNREIAITLAGYL